MKHLLLYGLYLFFFLPATTAAQKVISISIDGTINPASADFIHNSIHNAANEKAEALIDWRRDALEIERQVRAFNPWPVAETRMNGEQLRVFEASAEGSDHGGFGRATGRAGGECEAGTIVAVGDDAIVVQCGTGFLALRQVQRPGRRTVSAADFARGGAGIPELVGVRLG